MAQIGFAPGRVNRSAEDGCRRERLGLARIGFVGLGVMGSPMAGHLVHAGHDVAVYARSSAVADDGAAHHGGRVAASARLAAEGADFFITCVGNDDDVRAILTGAGDALSALAPGAVAIDHSTISATTARDLHRIATSEGIGFLDAPISGGQAGAEGGTLGIMVGGTPADFARAEPVMQAYGKTVALMGEGGTGQLTKMVNQIAVVGLVQGLAEGIAFAKAAGLDLERVMEVLTTGAGRSWLMENRWKTMAEGAFDFGFAVDLMRKDLAICLDEARRNGASLPVAALIDQFYADIQAMGGGRWDNSSLIARLDHSPEKERPDG